MEYRFLKSATALIATYPGAAVIAWLTLILLAMAARIAAAMPL